MHVSVNIFIAFASLLSIFVAVFSMPCEVTLSVKNFKWVFGDTVCRIWYIFDFSACTINFLKLIVVTVIRFMAIVRPHAKWAPTYLQILIFCLIWIFPIVLWSIIFSLSLDKSRSILSECYLIVENSIIDAAVVCLFLVPLLILVVLNAKLIWELKKRIRKVFSGQINLFLHFFKIYFYKFFLFIVSSQNKEMKTIEEVSNNMPNQQTINFEETQGF